MSVGKDIEDKDTKPVADVADATAAVAPDAERPGKKPKWHLIKCTWLRRLLKTLGCLLLFVLMLPVLVYVPFVQDFLKDIACDIASDATGMKIEVGYLRIKYPLDVELQKVKVIEATGDTMVSAGSLIADVKMLPLLKLDVQLNKVQLLQGEYNMVAADSSMTLGLRARLVEFRSGSSVNLKNSHIDLRGARLEDARINVNMDVWKQTPDTTNTPTEWIIMVDSLRLKNVDFSLAMLPTIDTLGLHIGQGKVADALIDLKNSNIKIGYFDGRESRATYLTPTAAYIAAHPAPVDTTASTPSAPMTVSIDSCRLVLTEALYATKGVKPQPGFDPSYISVTDADLSVKNFYNQASTLRLPITGIKAKERSGLEIVRGSGTVDIDSVGLKLDKLAIKTRASELNADAYLSFAMMALDQSAPMNVDLSGYLGWSDLYAFMPSLKGMLRYLPQQHPIELDLNATGSIGNLIVNRLKLNIARFLRLAAHGTVDDPMDFNKMRATLSLDGAMSDARVANRLAAEFMKGMGLTIPTFTLSGQASITPGNYAANLKLHSSAGDVKAQGKLNLNAERYDVDVTANGLNLAMIMPSLGVGTVTGHLVADGAGFNPTLPAAHTHVNADMKTLVYGGHNLAPLTLNAKLLKGIYDVQLSGHNPDLNLDLDARGSIKGNNYTADLSADMRHVDLYKLGFMPDICNGSGRVSLSGSANPQAMLFDLDFSVDDVYWEYGEELINLEQAFAGSLLATADSVSADIHGYGLDMELECGTGLKKIMAMADRLMPIVNRQISKKELDMEELQALLPPFSLRLNAEQYGLMGDALDRMGYQCAGLEAVLSNADSVIRGNVSLLRAGTESILLDTTTLDLEQRGKMLDYSLHIGNAAPNLPEFAQVDFNGYVGGNRASVLMRQRNAKGETGYRLGLTAALLDSIVSVHLTPLNATIAYQPWNISEDNYIDVEIPDYRIRGNLLAESAGSKVSLTTIENEGEAPAVALGISGVHIEDFLNMSVTAPPLSGVLDADITVKYLGKGFSGAGNVALWDLSYAKQRIGDVRTEMKAGYSLTGNTGGSLDLFLNNEKVMKLRGYLLTDSTTVRNRVGKQTNEVTMELTRFPLSVANPFLGPDMASLSGYLNGKMTVGGFMTSPVLNGAITCDSVGVYIPMAGSSIRFDEKSEIVVDHNVLRFDDFLLHAAGENTLDLNGYVDATSLSNILLNLSLTGRNVALINNARKAGSEIFGKLFIDLDASAKGSMEVLDVNANLSVLPSTDISYDMSASTAAMQQVGSTTDVVKFVQFADSTLVEKADSLTQSTMAMRVNATLSIVNGAEVTVLLSTNGTDKVQLNPYGSLTYTQNFMGDMRLNGSLYLGTGFVRYSVALIGEKTFNFDPNSYINWSGDLMNPALHINATDHVKANVQQNGANSRLIYFDVGLAVTGNLNAPKVNFDLSTDDDMTVQNELLSMTAEQRSASAMNLLLYNTYTGPGVKASANLSNPLYSFITGQLNSWAAKNIKGVDLSFGIDNYKQTVDGESSTNTSYSYQVSKSLFDNRFKIVVGGNYSTNADADENFAENLISDISFEYSLKQTQSLNMFLKLFRHTGYESILEGEVTETGVGFVMRRKLSSLRTLFRRPRKLQVPPADVDSLVPVTNDTIVSSEK